MKAILRRDPEERGHDYGDAAFVRDCCKQNIASVRTPFSYVEPPSWTCPTCGRRFVWDDDEAEGGAWYPVDL